MKRLPLFVSFIAIVALSASLAYWALQLFKLPQRPIAAAPAQVAPEANLDAAAGLFGGQTVSSVAVSNYQLKGVVAAGNGRGSVAILAVDGKPPQAVPVGREIASGVTLREVHPKHVLLSESGVIKRVELAREVIVPSERANGQPLPYPTPLPTPTPIPIPQQVPILPPAPAPILPTPTPAPIQAPPAVSVPGQPQAPARMTGTPTMVMPAQSR